ncbi:ZZ-type zinc finger-containing protein 3 [Coemansia javaensis]|uniref:ZZ-type zinc finger-containing protein 3 n=1 Tax=Coemansia javaensis TaxID=2761396 RepID=A0A9W8LMG2_9FUNG|nr:ZZ-type zinc finger-containing protein 3 [Coemansia javaensis]
MNSDESIAVLHAATAQPAKRHSSAEALSPATDHTAVGGDVTDIVRNNEEYMLVYRAIEALKSQLRRAQSDMEVLQRLRDEALAHPVEYVEALVSGTAAASPARQEVVEVPAVDAQVYLVGAGSAAAAKYAGSVVRSKPVRAPGALRWPLTAGGAGQLTGNTAVATPAYSPERSAAPAAGSDVGGHAVPRVGRANTEPIRHETAPGAAGAATLPSTPTHGGGGGGGKSQKSFTPQMVAEFRRPMSDDDDDDDGDDDNDDGGSRADRAHGGKSGWRGGEAAGRRGRPRKGARPRAAAPARARIRSAAHEADGEPKPASYNLPWSDEEQMRLEQLLVEFPEEEVANDRWRKISEALGTRTMRQVASRVQKYFIKLARAGLPVPGRTPDTSAWTTFAHHRATPLSAPPTTTTAAASAASAARRKRRRVDFTSSEDDGDYADDNSDDSDDVPLATVLALQPAPTDCKPQPPAAAAAAADHKAQMMPAADRKGKQVEVFTHQYEVEAPRMAPVVQTPALRSAKAVHLGYRCDSCLAEPIVGVRWHCLECGGGGNAVDLCDECREEGAFETEQHRAAHRLHPCRDAEMEPYYANEVAAAALQEYSYLA